MLPEIGVVLDAGTGMFRARDLIQTDSLAIFMTHAHLDHSIGLTFLFDVLFEKPIRSVDVYAESAKLDALRDHLFHEQLFPLLPPIDFHRLIGNCPVDLPRGGRLIPIPLEHPCGSLGFRLDWPGHSMAYITDTTVARRRLRVQGLPSRDLLFTNVTFPTVQKNGLALPAIVV
jgi:phosphoribosyl 1,2-cyclic phosphodiesterase